MVVGSLQKDDADDTDSLAQTNTQSHNSLAPALSPNATYLDTQLHANYHTTSEQLTEAANLSPPPPAV